MKVQSLRHIRMIYAISFLLLLTLILSGCTATEAKANILQLCGIISEEERQAYTNMVNNGQLDAKGNYAAEELDSSQEFIPPECSVHVTFAENAYIDVQYYLDASLKEPVDLKRCYLMPGDCIYASEPDCNHPTSNWYGFDRFCIYAYDGAGKRTQELPWVDEDAPLLIHIPADYTGFDVSVTPMGKYENRTLELTDYYTDSTGNQKELDGEWTVNDKKAATRRIDVSPVVALAVDYTYDADTYEFVDSAPDSFYHEKGLVRFETTFANNDIAQYSVELRELVGNFRFDPDQYLPKNGAVTFSYNGLPVNDVTYIDDGGSIRYTAIPNTGYRTTNSEGEISVDASDLDKTDAAIRAAIEFYPDEDVTVNLPQPKLGGKIEYSVDGKILSGEKCTLRCGTVITMKFDNWNHWAVDAEANKEYTVTAAKNQAVSLGDSDFSKLFWEPEEYMPTLNIIVKDSMKSAKFAVLASERGKNNLSYEDGSKNSIFPDWMGQNDREIFGGGKVGTGRDIVLAVTGDTVVDGEAMKLEIVKKEKGGNESKSIQYITDLPIEKPIGLYGASQPETSSTTYESVVIIVSKVKVSTYRATPIDHATVTVQLADENDTHVLKNGEVLESDRNVKVIFTPENGYYITGTKLPSGKYSETMKYSKWEKDYLKIRNKHPAQKLWYVTLDTSDNYGTCVYKLDGAVCSGRVGIRDDQKLTLEYNLTDSNYQIARDVWAVWESTEAKTVSITIDESFDGRTIHGSDYIKIERKKG